MNRDWRRIPLQSRTGGVSADLPGLEVPSGVHRGGTERINAVDGGAAVTLSPADYEGKHTVPAFP